MKYTGVEETPTDTRDTQEHKLLTRTPTPLTHTIQGHTQDTGAHHTGTHHTGTHNTHTPNTQTPTDTQDTQEHKDIHYTHRDTHYPHTYHLVTQGCPCVVCPCTLHRDTPVLPQYTYTQHTGTQATLTGHRHIHRLVTHSICRGTPHMDTHYTYTQHTGAQGHLPHSQDTHTYTT